MPHDGKACGELKARSPWVASAYYLNDKAVLDAESWFATGDVATIHPHGHLQITDRSKDVIKSGVTADAADILAYLADKVVKWWLPARPQRSLRRCRLLPCRPSC